MKGVPFGLPAWRSPLPFSYESTGTETRFTNRLDPEPRSRNVFAFHRPETLLKWAQAEKQLNQRLRELPLLVTDRLWKPQIEVITDLERSFTANKARAEQQCIVVEVERCLSVVEGLEAVVSANLQRATRLRQSILQRAFDGKLLTEEREWHNAASAEFPIAAETAATYEGSR